MPIWDSDIPAAVSALCLVLGLLLPQSFREKRFTGSVIGAVEEMGTVLKNRDFMVFALMVCIYMTGLLGYVSISSYIYQDGFGQTKVMYTVHLILTLVVGIAITRAVEKMVDSKGNRAVVPVLFILETLSIVCLFTLAG